MKSIVIEEKDIEIVYLFVVNELEQTLAVEEERKKQLRVKRNRF